MRGVWKEWVTHLCIALRIVDTAQHGTQLLSSRNSLCEHIIKSLLAP